MRVSSGGLSNGDTLDPMFYNLGMGDISRYGKLLSWGGSVTAYHGQNDTAQPSNNLFKCSAYTQYDSTVSEFISVLIVARTPMELLCKRKLVLGILTAVKTDLVYTLY